MLTAAAPLSVLIDAAELARMLSVSKPTIWRMRDGGKLPPSISLTSQCLRWRRRTGNPATGIEDWLEAGCPALNERCEPIEGTLEDAHRQVTAEKKRGEK